MLTDPSIDSTIKSVRSDRQDSPSWALLTYEDLSSQKKLNVHSTGKDGISEMISRLKDDCIYYGYLRVTTGDELSVRTKFVFFTFIGESVGPLKRARVSVHKAQVATAIQNYSVEIQASSVEDLSEERIMDKVIKSGGSIYGNGNVGSLTNLPPSPAVNRVVPSSSSREKAENRVRENSEKFKKVQGEGEAKVPISLRKANGASSETSKSAHSVTIHVTPKEEKEEHKQETTAASSSTPAPAPAPAPTPEPTATATVTATEPTPSAATETKPGTKPKTRIVAALGATQGMRGSMEDKHNCITNFKNSKFPAYFGVYDGHAGVECAEYVEQSLPEEVDTQLNAEDDPKEALTKAFVVIDQEYLASNNPLFGTFSDSGCTAVVALVNLPQKKLLVANLGDSRCVLSRAKRAKGITTDHKPNNKEEIERVEAAGHFVEAGRIDGIIAVSRALGDPNFKNEIDLPPESQPISCIPDVFELDLDDDDDFIILACDGLWDVYSNQEVVNFVNRKIQEVLDDGDELTEDEVQRIAENLVDSAVDKGSMDNVSAIIVALLP
eukprot:TRINITY_DN175_c0_g2_i2.p1 TRINITY_DN175_c0_g2~~TRINITY_DN175_c0_g2_i2.p1  ORF type:complete len:553 (-),score=181.91 TRINITY_DN175_c0_g2_i2:249-1907(-)